MDFFFENDKSRYARFRRELRNPSILTVIILVTVLVAIVSAPFAPTWVRTTQEGFSSIAAQKDLQEASMSSVAAIVPSQITPWMATNTLTMIEAEGPLDWRVVSFRDGPCNPGNLIQLPKGKYADAIEQGCRSFDDIQQRYSGDCFLASVCNVREKAKEEINQAMDVVWEAFSDAGFVLPYSDIEEQASP